MAELQQLHALSEPTYCRLKHSANPALLVTLGDLENVMAVFKSSQKQQDKIMSEAKLLKIMIYKRRRQLRSEKSIQLLRRVQACLKRAGTFGRLFTLIDDIHKDLLNAVDVMKTNDVVYLPAQQTWSYLLYLQLQYLMILDANSSYCITAFDCQFATGMLIPQMVVFMGIVARIWLLSRSMAEKIQSCYSPVYSLRQRFDRTNSAWKEPVLPPQLELSSYEEDGSDLQEMCHIASKVPVDNSVETVETKSTGKVQKNTVFARDEETEDIGVPVALKRTVNLDSSDNRSNKRKKTGESDFTPSKKRKQMNSSSKQDDVTGVSGKTNLHLMSTEMPTAKKKKKRKLEKLTDCNIEVKKNKKGYVQNGNKRKKSEESDFTPSKKRKQMNDLSKQDDVTGVCSVHFISTEMPTAKKKKKRKLEKLTDCNIDVKKNKKSYVQHGAVMSSTPKEQHSVENVRTHETSVLLQNNTQAYDVQPKKQKKHKKKKMKTVSSSIADGSKITAKSPKKTSPEATMKTGHQTTEEKRNIKQAMKIKATEAKSQKQNKLKRSKLKKKKYIHTK